MTAQIGGPGAPSQSTRSSMSSAISTAGRCVWSFPSSPAAAADVGAESHVRPLPAPLAHGVVLRRRRGARR